jgi:AcrR family transcriptional regulator
MVRGPSDAETTERLLAAAGEVFAEIGFRGATLREICRRGRANIAAVNYYFRDKQQLYAAVLDRAVVAAGEGMALLAPAPADPPEEKLRHLIHGFFKNLLGEDRPVQLLRLMAHEAVEPTPALDMVVEKIVRPVTQILDAVLAELLGTAADAVLVRDCRGSVLSLCGDYYHSAAFIRRVDHLDVHEPSTIEHLAEHVFRFSLGAIRALARGDLEGRDEKKLDVCPLRSPASSAVRSEITS